MNKKKLKQIFLEQIPVQAKGTVLPSENSQVKMSQFLGYCPLLNMKLIFGKVR